MPKKCSHELYQVKGSNYTCDGCEMSGNGLTYRCNKCNYVLHKECMNAKSTITPKIFPGYKFKFHKRPPPGKGKHKTCKKEGYCRECRNCDACGMPVKGYAYHYKKKDWDLHPRCASLDMEIKTDDVKFKLTRDVKSPCSECNNIVPDGAEDKIPGCCYVSVNDGGKFKFHVFCLMQMGMNNNREGGSSSKDCDGGALGKELEKIQQEDKSKKRKRGGGQEEVEKGIQRSNSKKRKRSEFYMKIFKTVLTTVLSILIGDPTTLAATVVVQLLT